MRWDILFFKQLFPSIRFKLDDGSIHLTFDDGPHPVATPIVLQELKKRDILATFFLLGQNAEKYPDLVRQIHADGHQIGNHSYTHSNLFFKNKERLNEEIVQTREILDTIIGTHSKYFRPPFGYFDWTTLKVLREQGLTCILWDINSKDYKLYSSSDITDRIIAKATNGSILLCHDNNLTSKRIQNYLPTFLDALQKKDFIFNILTI